MKEEHLTLKWGTLKSWEFHSEKSLRLLKEYGKLGMSYGAAQQHDTPRQKEIICELIDEVDGTVWNDWDNKEMSKEEAKEYVRNYGKKP